MAANSKPYLDGLLTFPEPEVDPLEELFAEAKARIKEERRDKNVRLTEVLQSFDDLYQREENWTAQGNVALVHRPSETLLGNFTVLVHRTVAGASRLVRTEQPVAVGGVRYVTGDWWLAGNREVSLGERTAWLREEIIAVNNLSLPAFGLVAVGTAVRVVRVQTWLSRVELTEETTFHSPEGRGLLTLPKGTDVLKGLAAETKKTLWQGGRI